jgi:hypothetical protein
MYFVHKKTLKAFYNGLRVERNPSFLPLRRHNFTTLHLEEGGGLCDYLLSKKIYQNYHNDAVGIQLTNVGGGRSCV